MHTPSSAGSLESCDILILAAPSGKSGIHITLESDVAARYGKAIREQVMTLLHERDISDIELILKDKGALECVIKARLLTALARGGWIEEAHI